MLQDANVCLKRITKLYQEMHWLEEAGIRKEKWIDEYKKVITHLLNDDIPDLLPSPGREFENDQTVETEARAQTQAEAKANSNPLSRAGLRRKER